MERDERYEVDSGGKIVVGTPCTLTPSERKTVIEKMFSLNGWKYTILDEISQSHFHIKVENTNLDTSMTFHLYHGNVRKEDPERNREEKKIQLGTENDPRQHMDDGIILGFYVSNKSVDLKDVVVVAWPIEEDKNYPANPSLRVNMRNDILPAKNTGYYVDKTTGKNLVVFRPEFIYHYLENYKKLHYEVSNHGVDIDDVDKPDVENNVIDESTRIPGGRNILLYGVPGSGKSWTIEHEYCKQGTKVERLVFHPDYTNADFIGQILPVVDPGRKIDPTFYSVIYGADESEDWTDPKVWKKANPSLGITVAIEKVKAACDSAKQNPGEENSFRQLRLNQWVKQSVRWMPMEKWDACDFAVNEDDLEGRVCYGGLDLSSTTDITAFVLVFPPLDEDDKYIVLPYFWVPEDTLDLRVRRDHVPYDLWERKGYLQTTEGNVVHYGYIENFIESLGERFNIREIAFDRWGAVQMVQNLEGMGFTVVPFGQGFKDMSPPTKELMKLVLEKKIVHGGHPVLRWNMDNIFIRTDPAGNIKADKEKSTEKIDGAIATIMALDRAIRCGNEVTESVYDTRGLLVF